jgi:hypothetical protein
LVSDFTESRHAAQFNLVLSGITLTLLFQDGENRKQRSGYNEFFRFFAA